ncbi:DoxX family protein [Gordonia phthalatica]|uniref:DoxX family protein n=1 Tax=Gordonia phthalatica TaxID=1136941 RepID=A0A0N9MNJ3_9ACTN|nr:DoxX family protein [Gordonia phthalatica]ALG83653.1 hypothetical protein ACH46_02975 [Gordonia phthalatica]
MNIALWIVAGVLAALFLMVGAAKAVKSKEQFLADPRMAWAENYPAGLITFIGVAEVLGAAGLILPGAFGIATPLVGIATIALAITMVGAIVVHVRRSEWQSVVMNAVLLALLVFVAVGRLGAYSF